MFQHCRVSFAASNRRRHRPMMIATATNRLGSYPVCAKKQRPCLPERRMGHFSFVKARRKAVSHCLLCKCTTGLCIFGMSCSSLSPSPSQVGQKDVSPPEAFRDVQMAKHLLGRHKGKVSHCKIILGSSGYGFAEPYLIHDSLTSLVLHYKEVSLAEHNEDLDVRLTFPVTVAPHR